MNESNSNGSNQSNAWHHLASWLHSAATNLHINTNTYRNTLSAIAPTPIKKPPIQPPFELSATPVKSYYLRGENIEIKFSFKNTGSRSINVSPFPPEIKLMRPLPYETVRYFHRGAKNWS